jgi:uncharacterized protein (UPF0261 family)
MTRQFTIAVLGTLDTKGPEHQFVAECIRQLGHQPLLIDVGTASPPTVAADISREQILALADSPIVLGNDRGQAMDAMAALLPKLMRQLVENKRIDGIVSLGGSCGTSLATAAMRALPLGMPKVMVSTMASGNVSQYVDVSDIVMMPSTVDVSGLNRISRGVFSRAASAIVGMIAGQVLWQHQESKPLIVASMFGNTTKCIEHARSILEAAGYEVLVFHATGTGGRTMEALIESGMVAGVLDITTTEWADQLAGGVMPGGPARLLAAAKKGVPAIVAPGCLDMVNFGPRETVPARYADRLFYQHNPQVTLMRTTAGECQQLGQLIAAQLNQSIGAVRVLYPSQAISVISAPGQPFHDAAADQALREAWQSNLREDIPFEIVDCEINDPEFAQLAARRLLDMIVLSS